MKARLVQWVSVVPVAFLACAAVAQIPLQAMQGMMRSTVRPTGAGAPPPYEFTWATAESNRNWTGAALSADGRRQTALVQWGLIYVSTNYGVAWSTKESARQWECVAMSADGARQTACVYDGSMYFSTNYGSTWTAGGESLYWVSIAMSADGSRQTAVDDGGYLYVSSDYGGTWTAKLTEDGQNWRRVSMSSNGQYQAAVCERKEDGDTGEMYGGGIYVSSDYGDTWTVKQSGVADWNGVAVGGTGARQTACAGGNKIHVSTDYGDTWTAKDVSRSWRCVSSSADGTVQWAIVAAKGIYKSTDYGTTWVESGPSQWWGYLTSSPGGAYHLATMQNGGLWLGR